MKPSPLESGLAARREENLTGKKLGLLLSTPPGHPGFEHGLGLANAALQSGLKVYLYCLDEAVHGLTDPRLQKLRHEGLVLYACAFGARKRNIPPGEWAVFAGLGALADLMAATDRFLSLK